ncbi:MAG: hypothetical protein U0R78_15755 [Nocardioidaceae bacterium]
MELMTASGGLHVRRAKWSHSAVRRIGELVVTDQGIGLNFWRAPRTPEELGLFIPWDDLDQVVCGPRSFVLRNRDGVGARFTANHRRDVRKLNEILRQRDHPRCSDDWTIFEGFNIGVGTWPSLNPFTGWWHRPAWAKPNAHSGEA